MKEEKLGYAVSILLLFLTPVIALLMTALVVFLYHMLFGITMPKEQIDAIASIVAVTFFMVIVLVVIDYLDTIRNRY